MWETIWQLDPRNRSRQKRTYAHTNPHTHMWTETNNCLSPTRYPHVDRNKQLSSQLKCVWIVANKPRHRTEKDSPTFLTRIMPWICAKVWFVWAKTDPAPAAPFSEPDGGRLGILVLQVLHPMPWLASGKMLPRRCAGCILLNLSRNLS